MTASGTSGRTVSGAGGASTTTADPSVSSSSGEAATGDSTTGQPRPVCGGECYSAIVEEAFATCESDLRDFPCDVPLACPPAYGECLVPDGICQFGAAPLDDDEAAYIAAVQCILAGLQDGVDGRYNLEYVEVDARERKLGPSRWEFRGDSVDGGATLQLLNVRDNPEGGESTILTEPDGECVREGLSRLDMPTTAAEAAAATQEISTAAELCYGHCMTLFEGQLLRPNGSGC